MSTKHSLPKHMIWTYKRVSIRPLPRIRRTISIWNQTIPSWGAARWWPWLLLATLRGVRWWPWPWWAATPRRWPLLSAVDVSCAPPSLKWGTAAYWAPAVASCSPPVSYWAAGCASASSPAPPASVSAKRFPEPPINIFIKHIIKYGRVAQFTRIRHSLHPN